MLSYREMNAFLDHYDNVVMREREDLQLTGMKKINKLIWDVSREKTLEARSKAMVDKIVKKMDAEKAKGIKAKEKKQAKAKVKGIHKSAKKVSQEMTM